MIEAIPIIKSMYLNMLILMIEPPNTPDRDTNLKKIPETINPRNENEDRAQTENTQGKQETKQGSYTESKEKGIGRKKKTREGARHLKKI